MPTARSLTRGGITWGFTHDVTYGQYVTGDYWVLGGPGGGVELSSITPTCVLGGPITVQGIAAPLNNTHLDINGSMVNPHWRQIAEALNVTTSASFINFQYVKGNGYGIRPSSSYNGTGYSRQFNFAVQNGQPISNSNRRVLPVNSSLVSTDTTKDSDFNFYKKAAVLTCVSAVPPDGAFRPAYNSLDKGHYYTSADVDYTALANLQASSVSSLMPSSTYVNRLIAATSGVQLSYQRFTYPMWDVSPHDNTGGWSYGDYWSKIPSVAVGYINTNLLSLDNKKTIANNLIQMGIDCFGSLERSQGSPLGYTEFIGGGGGHHQGFEMPAMFLTAILRGGTTAKDRAKALMDLAEQNKIFLSHGQFYEYTAADRTKSAARMALYPSLSSVSAILTVQASDVGLPAFKHGDSSPQVPKLWAVDEYNYYTSSIPNAPNGYGEFYSNYRMCCTSYNWGPFLLGIKAMGSEKILGHDILARYYEMYNRRQRFGPLNNSVLNSFLAGGIDLSFYGSSTSPVSIGSLDQTGLVNLYESIVKHSFQDTRGTATVQATLPLSGVESLGISTDPNIYIEAPSSFRPGLNNPVKCYGVSGYQWPDLLVLLYSREDYWLDNPVELFGARFHIWYAEGQIPFTSVSGNVATCNVPVNPVAVGGTNIIQVLSVRAINGQLEVKTTNALKVTILP